MIKNKFLTLSPLVFIALFTGCGGGGGSNTESTSNSPADITLVAGEYKTCTTATSFTVTPTSDPIVTFSTDADSGDTTITLNSDTTGSIVIKNCTTK